VEAQGSFAPAGSGLSVFRMVSRFGDYTLDVGGAPTAVAAAAVAAAAGAPGAATPSSPTTSPTTSPIDSGAAGGDTLRVLPHRLVIEAHGDAGTRWHSELGRETGAVAAGDFVDVAPDAWRPTGAPRLELVGEQLSQFFRFNRVEGAYTGLAARLRFRGAAPGVTLRAHGGWAWAEGTARGGAAAELARGGWLAGVRVERRLDNTNDFRQPWDRGATLIALFGAQDNYDYVDRRTATVSLGRALGESRGSVARVELGLARDDPERRRVRRGLVAGGSPFRPNRGVAPGRYVRSAAVVEYRPDVSAEFLSTGVGARLLYERGDGELDWQRVEGRLTGRRYWGRVGAAARVDAGAIIGASLPPPQTLYELGADQGLPGYGYKVFGGDQAAVVRGLAMYTFGVFASPVHVWRWVYLPAPAPAVSVGAQSGWTGVSRAATWRSLAMLGTTIDATTGAARPVSAPTGGVRTTVDLRLRFFGGGVNVGVARPVDRRAPWRVIGGLEAEL
jgi:hypothetical protein